MKIVAAMLLLSVSVFAQSAKVVQLSPVDAAEAKSLYEQKAAIEKKLADLTEKIQHQYINGVDIQHDCALFNGFPIRFSTGPCVAKFTPIFTPKPGWENGFEFSEDFKFIVPKAYTSPNTCYSWTNGNFYSTPVQIPYPGLITH